MGMLDDIRVLDFSHVYFGPYSTMIMADMGADVIKIEPPWGEIARLYPPHFGGVSSVFHYLDRNKKGVSLNLKDPKAKEIIYELVKQCDVVVENFKRIAPASRPSPAPTAAGTGSQATTWTRRGPPSSPQPGTAT